MEQLKEFVLKHFKVITVVLTFVLTMYIQHLNNTRQIEELLNKCEVLDTKIKDQYERIDTIKLDKAVFEATITQFASIQNNTALLSDIERIKVDSTTMAVDAKALRLTIDEYERFRAADAEKIRQMGVKIKDLQAAAKHQLEVAAPINAVIRDTVFIRDTVPVIQQKVEMVSPHIQLDAVIDNDSLKGDIRLPVTLQQTVWVEYKRKCLFWKKVKAIHQTISSDYPYVDIKYSEYIQIDKK